MYTPTYERFLNIPRKLKFQFKNLLGLRPDVETAYSNLTKGKEIVFHDSFKNFDNWIKFDDWDTILPRGLSAITAENSVITEDGAEIQIVKKPTTGYKYIKVGDEWKKVYETRPYGTGHLFTKDKFGKGRYIAILKYPELQGAWSCFWPYVASSSEFDPYIQEMDIGEHMYFDKGDRDSLPFYCHTGETYEEGGIHYMVGTTVRYVYPTSRYFVLHMDWTDDYMECGIDGIPVFRTRNNIFIHDMQVRFTANVAFKPVIDFPQGSKIASFNIKSFTYAKL